MRSRSQRTVSEPERKDPGTRFGSWVPTHMAAVYTYRSDHSNILHISEAKKVLTNGSPGFREYMTSRNIKILKS